MSDRGAEPSAEGEPAALDPDVGGRASAERSSQQHPGYPFVDFRAMCFNAYKGLHNGQTPAQRGEGKQFEAKCLSQWKEVGGRRRPEGEVDSTSSSQISPKAACVRGEQESRERRAGVLRRLRLVIFRCACAGSRRHGAFHFSETNVDVERIQATRDDFEPPTAWVHYCCANPDGPRHLQSPCCSGPEESLLKVRAAVIAWKSACNWEQACASRWTHIPTLIRRYIISGGEQQHGDNNRQSSNGLESGRFVGGDARAANWHCGKRF